MPCDKPIIGQAIHWLSQSELLLSHSAGPGLGTKLRALSEEREAAVGFGFHESVACVPLPVLPKPVMKATSSLFWRNP